MMTSRSKSNLKHRDEAEIDGYTDGFVGKDKAGMKYIGNEKLFAIYVRAKVKGTSERSKIKARSLPLNSHCEGQ